MPLTDTSNTLDKPVVPRFIVGIDLGTTNCAVAFVDSESSDRRPQVFMIPQLIDWQTIEKRTTLPSFYYEWTTPEATQIQSLPSSPLANQNYCVGILARDRGLQAPGRQISSAKSWLCHSGVDRTASILPWQGDPDVERLSPVVASSYYLVHLRKAWDLAHPHHPLAECDVVVTLPASFDEVARELTIEAAKLAGLPKIVLIEEPLAAFYAWLSKNEDNWQSTILSGHTVLICDIGGGTTDFTLIRVREESQQKFGLHRVAVGQHLMLGGDNFDLSLAKTMEARLLANADGNRLEQLGHAEFESLRQQCRAAKETLLGENAPPHYVVAIAGRGSRLIDNVRTVDVTSELAERTLLDGFFPDVALDAEPDESEVGLLEFGLPYASDPAITRHLATFLWQHRWDGRPDEVKSKYSDCHAARPDWVLFNGGVLESPQIRDRFKKQLNTWFGAAVPSEAKWEIGELESRQLDLAVAIGAAYFGLVRRGEGVRIDARLARSYYLQVNDDPPEALCVMPGDAIPLDRFILADHPFHLEIGRPIQFPILVSSTNLVHRVGEIVSIDDEHMRPLPAIQTVLESSRHKRLSVIPIILESELSEIGTLDLSLVTASKNNDDCDVDKGPSIRWRLAFDLRSTVETDRTAHRGTLEQSGIVDSQLVDCTTDIIQSAFSSEASPEASKNLVKNLAAAIGVSRYEWKPSLLRSMWQVLIDIDPNHKRTSILESRWLNLVGFCLRPGYGFAADDWRVAMTWRAVQGKLKHASNAAEAMVLWRRIAGGFTVGQQQALYQEVQGRVREILDGGNRAMQSNQESMELLRLVGSLELIAIRDKKLLGAAALKAIHRSKFASLHDPILWMLGRVAARTPVYAPLNHVPPADIASEWARSLSEVKSIKPAHHLALMQMTRKTGDRYRDVSSSARERALETLKRWSAPESYLTLVREIAELDLDQRETIIGESLPLGIRIRP